MREARENWNPPFSADAQDNYGSAIISKGYDFI